MGDKEFRNYLEKENEDIKKSFERIEKTQKILEKIEQDILDIIESEAKSLTLIDFMDEKRRQDNSEEPNKKKKRKTNEICESTQS